MPGSAQPYVRSKRREKWRQRHPFGDIDTTLPTELMTHIKVWMNEHFLKINPDKTEIIVLLPENLRKEQLIFKTFL